MGSNNTGPLMWKLELMAGQHVCGEARSDCNSITKKYILMQDVKKALEPLLHTALTAEVQEQTSFVSASIMPNIYLTNNSPLRFIHFSPDSNQIF